MKEILIRTIKQPKGESMENDLEWFCESLGFLGTRDKNKTAVRVFKAVIEQTEKGSTTIDQVSQKVNMSRTAVVNHLTKMIESGVISREGGKIELRSSSLQKMIDEIKLDVSRTLDSIREIAEAIDEELELPVRRKK